MMKTTLQKGDMILFFAGDTWLSKSISYLTDAEVTHASMVYSEDSIVEILADGIQVNKIALATNEQEGQKAYLMRHVPELDFEPLKKSADAYLESGVSYDFPGLYLLGILLIYNKFVPTPQFLHGTELILEAGIYLLDHFIQKHIKHNSGKAAVCSQMIYQIFYDCGGDYRIPIVDGCLSVKKNADDCRPGEVRLIDLINEDCMPVEKNTVSLPSDTETINPPSPDSIENATRELYLALTQATLMESLNTNSLFSKSGNMDKVLSLTRQYLDRIKLLQEKLHSDLPLDAMFVTVGDLAYHAPSLQRVDTIFVKRL